MAGRALFEVAFEALQLRGRLGLLENAHALQTGID
jgi:hypothetical protein